jgi:DNA-binding transcriptional LysR family regulator
MRADHPAANKSLGTDDYLRLPQVSLVAAHSDRDNVLTRTLHRQGLKRNVRLEVPSFASIPGIVVSTDLVATLPAGMARQYAQYFDFRILKLPIRTEPFRIFQVWHERFDDDAGHRWMRETMKEVCRRL